ncbi:MAG: hypothetical protein IJS57_05575 [Paludibacteraceae bacterium]|nr:hypothetical protein [Paludibacteraceae bacterium]
MRNLIFPEIIQDVSEYLASARNFRISSSTHDGRINSALNEDEILTFLELEFRNISTRYKFVRPNAREWYDFAIENNNEFYPVNIKVTNCATADNLNSKLGIYYAMTGLIPSFNNSIGWESFLRKLKQSFGRHKDKDYYFLIINKKDLSDVFCCSLKTLTSLVPNGNNLPFQSRWTENRDPVGRSFYEAAEFIMATFATSFRQRAAAYEEFERCFPEYV